MISVALVVHGKSVEGLDGNRESLFVVIDVDCSVLPRRHVIVPGGALPSLIELLQKVLADYPALTTERAKEGMIIPFNKAHHLVDGPEGEQ